MITLASLLNRTNDFSKQVVRDIIVTITVLLFFSITIIFIIKIFSQVEFAQLISEFVRPITIAFGGEKDTSYLLSIFLNTVPLILSAFAFSIPFKAGFFNIGSDGIMIISSLCYLLTFKFCGLIGGNSVVLILLPILMSIFAGALWGIIPYFFKRFASTNEVITGLFFNNIALISAGYILSLSGTFDKAVSGTQSISFYDKIAPLFLVSEVNGRLVSIFIPLSLFFVFLAGTWLWFSKGGLHARAVGVNSKAADVLGLSPNCVVLKVVLLGSFCASLCAINETLAYSRFSVDAINGMGFDGIMVAILGGHRISGIVIASVFWSMWRVYGAGLQNLQLPYETLLCAQALFLIGYLVWQRFNKAETQFL